jgi:hypothetical protein
LAPSSAASAEKQVFQCAGGRVVLGIPVKNTVLVSLTVGYLVESTSENPEDFIGRLETALLGTALLAALQCNHEDGAGDRRQLLHSNRHLLEETIIVGTCTPEIEEARSCHFMETNVSFLVNGDIDPDEAAYAGYSNIEHNMEDGTFLELVDEVVRIVYLSPLPLPSPPQESNADGETMDPSTKSSKAVSSSDNSGVSPYTIGACVATVMGG